MQDEINTLKEEERLSFAEETLKIDIDEIPAEKPRRSQSTRQVSNRKPLDSTKLMIGGLVGLGIMSSFGLLAAFNLWALLFLIPAGKKFSEARSLFKRDGYLNRQGRDSVLGGSILAAIGGIMFFNLSWSLFFPIMLISIGATTLVGNRMRAAF